MKYIYKNIILSFILLLSSAFLLKAQNPITINVTNNDVGTLTQDICYSQSKNLVFAYGYKKLLVFDATNNNLLHTEDLSQYGEFEIDFKATEILKSQGFMFVDEAQNMMYCVTPQLNIIRLDISNPNDIQSSTVVSQDIPSVTSGPNILKWDQNKRRFYWAFGTSDGLFHIHVYHIDQQNSDPILIFSNNNVTGGIFDIAFTENSEPYNDVFYLSISGGVIAYDALNFTPLPIIDYPNEQTVKKFFVETTETNYKRLFCLPYDNASDQYGNITIINTETHLRETEVELGFDNVLTAAFFESTNDLILGTYPLSGHDIMIYNSHPPYNNKQILNTDSFNDHENHPYSMLFSNGGLFISKVHEIIKLTEQSGNYSFSVFETGFTNFYNKGIVSNSDNLFFINQVRSGIEKFVNQESSAFLQSGTMIYESLFFPDINDSNNNKVIFFSKLNHDHSTLVMVNANDYSNSTTYEFDKPIGDCIYNEYRNELLLVTYNQGITYLQVFNTLTSTFEDIENLDLSYCGEMYISPTKKLYITSNMKSDLDPVIKVINAIDYSHEINNEVIDLQQVSGSVMNVKADFTFNEVSKDVYFCMWPNSPNIDPSSPLNNYGIFAKFNALNVYEPLNTTYSHPKKLFWAQRQSRYPSYGDCFFIVNNADLIVWDCYTELEETTLNIENEKIFDIETNSEKNKVFVITNNAYTEINYVYSLDINNNFGTLAEFGNKGVTGLSYNPFSYQLMAYSRYDGNGNAGIFVFDPEASELEVNYTAFENKNLGWMADETRYEPIISYNTMTNKLFIPNGTHSNATVMDYVSRERLVLTPGSNWISIPRHLGNLGVNDDESWPTDQVFTQSTVENGFSELHMQHYYIYPNPPYNTLHTYADYVSNPEPIWTYSLDGYLADIYSPLGYKLEYIPGEQEKFLYLEGIVEDPETYIQLYQENMNWVGYFLPEEQDAFDALGTSVLSDLTEVWGENFYCYKRNGIIQDGPTYGSVTGTYWVCDKSDRTLHYGDMVSLTSMATTSFQWQNTGLPSKTELRPAVTYFEYIETMDYTPIIIELDYINNPIELGAYVDTVCVGAVALMPEDTAVILRAYLEEGYAAEDIVFQEYFGTKSSQNNVVSDYFVYNEKTHKFENHSLKGNFGNKLVYISFKTKSESSLENGLTNINIWPNPAHNKLNYNFYVENDGHLLISIYDISGKVVSVPYKEDCVKGSVIGNIELKDSMGNYLLPGIYFVKININNNITTKKLIVQ